MAKHYFKKELLSNTLRGSDGNVVPFEACSENCGVIVIDDEYLAQAALLADLSKIAGSRGVARITEEKYEELKKKLPSTRSLDRLKGPRLFDPSEGTPWGSIAGITPPQAQQPVIDVTGLAAATAAETKSPAASAEAPASSKPAFKPRVGKAAKK